MNSIEFFCALQLLFYGKVEKTRSGGRKLDEKECRSGSKIVFLPNRYIFLDAPTLNIHNSTHSASNLKQFFSGANQEHKGPEKYSLDKNISPWASDIPYSVAQNIENSDVT